MSSRVVHKYGVQVDQAFDIELPDGATFLHMDAQQVEVPVTAFVSSKTPQTVVGLFVWALVDPEAPIVKRKMYCVLTGKPMDEPKEYIGTAQVGPYVFHLFEMPSKSIHLRALGDEEINLQ